MLRRRRSRHSTTSSIFLFAGLVALVVLLLMFLPATEGKAQHQALGTVTNTPLPTDSQIAAAVAATAATPTTTVQTNTQTPAALPTAECAAEWKVVPAPGLGTYNDIEAISSDDVWVVGENGAIHWDGASWSQVPTAGITSLRRISAVGHADVWATNGATVIRWDGTAWSLAYDPPKPEGQAPGYLDLVAISADDVWVVGSHWANRFSPQTYAIHWDGQEWAVTDSPAAGRNGSMMISVSGIPGGHVWATAYNEGAALLRWTGEYWDSTSPEGGDVWPWQLSDIEVIAPNDIWVGGYRSNGSTALQHYDGSQWNHVSSPDIRNVSSISTVAPDDAWVVGQHGTLHWDGSAWSQVPAPEGWFAAVDAIGSEDVWAVQANVVLHYSNDPFWDVPSSNPFYSYVRCLTCLGIVSGYSDASYRPNERVSRGQAAKIIAYAAGYNDDIPATRQTFADVPPDSPFWVYIERMYEHGAIGGYLCDGESEPCPGIYYRPGAYLTRGQLAKIASNVAGYDDTPGGQTFNDVPPGSPFYTFVERAAAHNVISGYPCGTPNPDTGEYEPCPGTYFRPASNVTRGQTAKIVVNSLLPECELPTRP